MPTESGDMKLSVNSSKAVDQVSADPGCNPTRPATAKTALAAPYATAQAGAIRVSTIKYLHVVAGLTLFFAGSVARMQTREREPIATIGHGGFFDHEGRQIEVTQEFVARAQDWYRTKLLSSLRGSKKIEFAKVERRLSADVKAGGQSRLVVRQHLLDWLAANSENVPLDSRTAGKLKALKSALRWKLPERPGMRDFKQGEKFTVAPEVEEKLKSPEFAPGEIQLRSATINSGQAYINECIAAGVPTPPPIGQLDPDGLTGWKSQGFIPEGAQFIVGTPAEVRTFQSSSPVGMCVALPRYTNASLATVMLDGVICLGQASSKVCFWDNQMDDVGFPFPSGTIIPIGVPDLDVNPDGLYQPGGFELEGGDGGECTDCHAGQNPYIIHPNVNLGGGLLMRQLREPPLSLPTFPASRYDPLVAASWPQNQLSHSPDLVPGSCSSCHSATGFGGAFPHLSEDIPGYCRILKASLGILPLKPIGATPPNPPPTMPLGSPGSLRCTPNLPPSDPRFIACEPEMTAPCSELTPSDMGYIAPSDPRYLACTPEISALVGWCGEPLGTDASTRGDPHIETVDGINYDFQSAGEFVSLRSGSSVEIQTRQTAISTSFFPGPNPYTGLATCASLNTAVAARVGDHRVTYEPNLSGVPDPGGLQLRVDGVLKTLGASGLDLGNGGRVKKTSAAGGIEVDFPDGTVMYVTPGWWADQGKWYLDVDVPRTPAVKGIMGALAPGSWLPALPDGTSLGPKPTSLNQRYADLYQRFADAWRVTSGNSLFDYAPGTSTHTFTLRGWPPLNPPCTVPQTPVAHPVELAVAERACSQVTGKNRYDNCVFDVRVTGELGFAKTYLAAQQVTGVETGTDGENTTGGGIDTNTNPPSGKVAFFLDLGAGFPHGTFSNVFDPGFSFNAGLEYIVNPHFSAEAIFGYHHFPGIRVQGVRREADLFQFSANAKTYLTPPANKVRPFLNGGIGAYRFSPGSTRFGGNAGAGMLFELTPRFGLQGSYNFHAVNTPGLTTRFSTLQGGARFRF